MFLVVGILSDSRMNGVIYCIVFITAARGIPSTPVLDQAEINAVDSIDCTPPNQVPSTALAHLPLNVSRTSYLPFEILLCVLAQYS